MAAVLVIVGWAAAASGEDLPPTPVQDEGKLTEAARKYPEIYGEYLRLSAQAGFRQQQGRRLADGSQADWPVWKVVDYLRGTPYEQAVAAALRGAAEPVVQGLQSTGNRLQGRERELIGNWQQVREERCKKSEALFELEANNKAAGTLLFLLSADNRWFWLFGVVALAFLVGVVWHERRHEVRRWLNGGWPRAIGLAGILNAALIVLGVVTLALFVFGNWIYLALLELGTGAQASPHRQVAEENRQATLQRDEAVAALASASQRCEEARNAWQEKLPESVRADARLLELLHQFCESAEPIAVTAAVQEGLVKGLQTDLKELERVRNDFGNSAERIAACHRKRQWVQRLLGVGLLGLVAVCGGVFHRRLRRKQQQTRATCPTCLGENTFALVTSDASNDTGEPAVEAGMMQCTSLISEHTRQHCGFAMYSQYLDMPKICFPTLGIPSAGKTHWLVMTYRELRRGNYKEKIRFEKVHSSMVDKLDAMVDEVLNDRLNMVTTPEQQKVEDPLVLEFTDRDRYGKSDILVNLFDYSGEVTRRQTLADRQRRRALDGDGFLFFLDPTSSGDYQSKELDRFREDLRKVKGIRKRQLRIPVALCISKIDMLVNQSYARGSGNDAIHRFYRRLEEVGWDSTLPAIKARSDVVRELCTTVWPGWAVERTIHHLFGGRHMFFPLTPVGLNGVGIEDLRQRMIDPLGLLEPLLWLLQMNGYPVFK